MTAGTTYYFMVIDDQSDGSGNGGTLVLSSVAALPPPVVNLTVNRFGTFDKTGAASVYGTISCTGEVEFSFIFVELNQPVGRGPFTAPPTSRSSAMAPYGLGRR